MYIISSILPYDVHMHSILSEIYSYTPRYGTGAFLLFNTGTDVSVAYNETGHCQEVVH